MLFQKQEHPLGNTQTEIRQKRQTFRKQIRKSIIDQKLATLRKKFIIDTQSYQPIHSQAHEQTHLLECYSHKYKQNLFQNSSCEEGQNNQEISSCLQILVKFKNINLEKFQPSKVKKFCKKIDAAVLLLAHIEKLIIDEKIIKNFSEEQKNTTKIEIQGSEEKNLKEINSKEERLKNLKEIEWQSEPKLSNLQLLKEITQLVFFEKVQTLLSVLEQNLQGQSNERECPSFIPLGLIKWIYFWTQNMNHYLVKTTFNYKKCAINSSSNVFETTFREFYFQTSLKVIKHLSLSQITQVLFNPIVEIDFLQDLTLINNREMSINFNESFISCSPFQLLIEGQAPALDLLKQFQKVMQQKIEKKTKWLTIEYLKMMSLGENSLETLTQLKKQGFQLENAAQLLQILSDRLNKKKNKSRND